MQEKKEQKLEMGLKWIYLTKFSSGLEQVLNSSGAWNEKKEKPGHQEQ